MLLHNATFFVPKTTSFPQVTVHNIFGSISYTFKNFKPIYWNKHNRTSFNS
ncbi:hypothetical protein HanIR_Chr04g0192981 [Helianthus annuus]|nr:hypothetical protein HanIR_Chr04g0192981 [Helianthus annuus]